MQNAAKGVFQTGSRSYEEAKIMALMSLDAGVAAKVNAKKLRDGEIDFTVINGNKKCFVQVSYYMESESTLKREYGAFDKMRDNSPKYVISLDKKDTSRNGITHMNVIDFLMNKADLIFS